MAAAWELSGLGAAVMEGNSLTEIWSTGGCG